jgi:DNA adenine methylase
MRYLGGKYRLRKKISKVLQDARATGQPYWEPFVGAAWVLCEMQGTPNWASDICQPLIVMWQALQRGWRPPSEVSEQMYYDIRDNPGEYHLELIGFVGFACSWGGKWFGGYARGEGRNFAAEGVRSLEAKLERMPKTTFICGSYDSFRGSFDEPALIYCDPPYAGTTGYDAAAPWDATHFWGVVDGWARWGHTVYVSEYTAPNGVECVAEWPTKTDIHLHEKEDRIERLFKLGDTT